MASDDSIWFRIGHAVERARHGVPSPVRAHGRSGSRGRGGGSDGTALSVPDLPSSDELIAAGVTLIVDRAFAVWGGRSAPGVGSLLRSGLAGGAAALLVNLVGPLLRDEMGLPGLDRDTVEDLLAGIGQGLVYGAVIEPRVPGPAVLKGVVYGSAEYSLVPLGGLGRILGSHAPQRKLPFIGALLDGPDGPERAYLEHLIFGIALALIYESSSSSSGMRPDEEGV